MVACRFTRTFFAGIGGELLFSPINSRFALGVDIHQVQRRDYDMLFDLKDYATTTGHESLF